MYTYLIIFLGAGLGGAARHAVNLLTLHFLGAGFPFGTLAVNVVGSFSMGVLFGWFSMKAGATDPWRIFLTTGVLGGFTTFSAFSLDAISLYERGQPLWAAGYVIASIMLGLMALMGGLSLIRSLV